MAVRRLGAGAALVVAALVVGAAAARASPRPPVIREPFTPLPCPAHPTTTIGLEGCAEKTILARDRAIDSRVRVIFGLLEPGERAGFVLGEGAWLRYRNASCAAQSSRYAGGTLEPLAYARCLASRDTTHLGDLADLERSLRTP